MTVADVIISRHIPRDLSVLKAEIKADHRVAERRFLIDYLPANSVGAELGVYSGLFSALLTRQRKFRKVTFVDPWWKMYGDKYPNWGSYTDSGRVSTNAIYAAAKKRIQSFGPNRFIEVESSYSWLEEQPDESLDWVYLDSTHTYYGTKRELELLDKKIKPDGLICGDDWSIDRTHRHHGVTLAVSDVARDLGYEFVLCGINKQWIIRRKLKDRSSLKILWEDKIYSD